MAIDCCTAIYLGPHQVQSSGSSQTKDIVFFVTTGATEVALLFYLAYPVIVMGSVAEGGNAAAGMCQPRQLGCHDIESTEAYGRQQMRR